MSTTIHSCISSIGVSVSDLPTSTRDEQWSFIKKSYFRLILKVHPDKSGNLSQFREVQSAFEALRDLHEKGAVTSFTVDGPVPTQKSPAGPMPSWEFFEVHDNPPHIQSLPLVCGF